MRFFINRYVLGSRRLGYAVCIKRHMLGSGYAILFKLVTLVACQAATFCVLGRFQQKFSQMLCIRTRIIPYNFR